MENFASQDLMMKSRLKHLNINLEVSHGVFEASGRAGFSNYSDTSSSESIKEYSFLLEQRMFEVSMGNFDELSFTEDFKRDVKNLPDNFAVDDEQNRARFETFFGIWGHFVITSAFGGGSVEMKINTHGLSTEENNISNIKAELTAAFSGGLFTAGGSMSGEDNTVRQSTAMRLLNQSTMTWTGGNQKFHTQATMADPNLMAKWRLSLTQHPAMLSTDMSLCPISILVQRVKEEKEYACHRALKDFLGGEFENQKKKEKDNKEKIEKEAKEAGTKKEDSANNKPKPKKGRKCFPSNASTTVLDGGKEKGKSISSLCIGDLVKTLDKKTKLTKFTQVITFAHFDKETPTQFLKIKAEDCDITLSANHLIFTGRSCKTKQAGEVKVNDEITLSSGNFTKVIGIENIEEKGFICPITECGTMLVDGVLVSCYASCKDLSGLDGHYIAHIGLLPLRIKNKLMPRKECTKTPKMDPYIKKLKNMNLPIMT